jgi:hypothetical protein
MQMTRFITSSPIRYFFRFWLAVGMTLYFRASAPMSSMHVLILLACLCLCGMLTDSPTTTALQAQEALANRLVESNPKKFIYHSTGWGKFRDGTDNIEVGGFYPVNHIRGE